ncbi:ArsR/SmtB family transcription factor [Halolamina rubra]|uniref:ArsR/SmtB family transcription factor n=1 Tax=Halolamina rubra TaxID=1380430 RepID=UPI0006795647|nr:helix-turn-helix domain-containing protein [Halolamina rubra]
MGEEPSHEIMDTMGDEMARRLLIAVRKDPQSAKELAEACEMSLPTVYRRMDALIDHGLVTERTVVTDDGNHYKEYRCNFDSTVISLGDQQFDIEIHR